MCMQLYLRFSEISCDFFCGHWSFLKVNDLGSRPMEQEEKENNNNHETGRKRPGQDTDGERSSFIHSINALSIFWNFTFDSLFRLSYFPALAKREENTAEQRTSRKPCSPRSRMKVSFYFLPCLCQLSVLSISMNTDSLLHIFIFFYRQWILLQLIYCGY